MKKVLILLLIFASLFSYSQELQKGVVINAVSCEQNPDQTYALYLPSFYDASKKWPAVFVFEPAARGPLPVTKFQEGAEALGYIIISSNNSRNGSWDLAFDAGDAMFADAFARFNIDIDRVYTSGFSGGSRVASAIASLTGKIRGVIACGAGFATVPDYQLSNNSKVLYASVVGNQDMNYQEHRELANELDKKQVTNTRIIFNAGHQWPQSVYLKEALYWMELQNFKKQQKVSEQFSVERAFSLTKSRADSMLTHGDYVSAHATYLQLLNDYDALIDLKDVNDAITQIEEIKDYKKQSRQKEKIDKLEMEQRQLIGEAFTELYYTKLKVEEDAGLRDMTWWQNKIDYYKKLSRRDDFQMANMARRILNSIWARCAESSFNYINNKDYETAMVLTKVWLYAEPNNWARWNMAKILANMDDAAFFDYLQEIVSGPTQLTKQSILKEEAFKNYLDDQKMKAILDQLN
ncbi:hypothetical protein [Fulvivirga lutimaris]|uniref:hypothetical protein n=1 Tax=Fulvivirga lutimaris TaxID=1819566 RepID=UPI0012BC950F|nr:hypothetical protein [Fulvivirga lutimaris]MTI40276.1 hypothetical protein [Fulvivirga lutimaris]